MYSQVFYEAIVLGLFVQATEPGVVSAQRSAFKESVFH